MNIIIVGTVLAFIATVLSGGIAGYAALQRRAKPVLKSVGPIPQVTPEEQYAKRLGEVQDEQNKRVRDANLNRVANVLLIIGQYVIGATLTSSFIQELLSPVLIGILGLIVLISTSLQRALRMDDRVRIANNKANWLNSAIRKAEDGKVALDNQLPGAPTIDALIAFLSKALEIVSQEDGWDSYTPDLPDL